MARAEQRSAGRPTEHAWTRRDVSTAELLERVENSKVEKPRETENDSNDEPGGDQTAVDEGAELDWNYFQDDEA